MPAAAANGITIEYETFGDPTHPALLLVMGLGAQLVSWDEEFIERFVEREVFVIRFDNRDAGLSTSMDGHGAPDLAAALSGDRSAVPYLLSDMAADAVGLLDHLGIERAHVLGASMGGMIAQTIAIEHPERVLSLCSVMSTTGSPLVGAPAPEAAGLLVAKPPRTLEEAIDSAEQSMRVFGSKGLPVDWDRVRGRAEREWVRGRNFKGLGRQLVAIMASGDRTEALGQVTVPTLVVHGTDDALVTISGGEATHAAIPGSVYLPVEGMGHDLPPAAWARLVEAEITNIATAEAALTS